MVTKHFIVTRWSCAVRAATPATMYYVASTRRSGGSRIACGRRATVMFLMRGCQVESSIRLAAIRVQSSPHSNETTRPQKTARPSTPSRNNNKATTRVASRVYRAPSLRLGSCIRVHRSETPPCCRLAASPCISADRPVIQPPPLAALCVKPKTSPRAPTSSGRRPFKPPTTVLLSRCYTLHLL